MWLRKQQSIFHVQYFEINLNKKLRIENLPHHATVILETQEYRFEKINNSYLA
jgi:hypothetical protein